MEEDPRKEKTGEYVLSKSQEDEMEELTNGTRINIQTDVMEEDEAKKMQ